MSFYIFIIRRYFHTAIFSLHLWLFEDKVLILSYLRIERECAKDKGIVRMSEELFISSSLGKESHGTATSAEVLKLLESFATRARWCHYRLLCLSRHRRRAVSTCFAILAPGRGTLGGVSAWIGNVTRVLPALKLDSPRRALNLAWVPSCLGY